MKTEHTALYLRKYNNRTHLVPPLQLVPSACSQKSNLSIHEDEQKHIQIPRKKKHSCESKRGTTLFLKYFLCERDLIPKLSVSTNKVYTNVQGRSIRISTSIKGSKRENSYSKAANLDYSNTTVQGKARC